MIFKLSYVQIFFLPKQDEFVKHVCLQTIFNYYLFSKVGQKSRPYIFFAIQ